MELDDMSPRLQAQAPANVLEAAGTLDPTRAITEVWLSDGRVVRLATAVLIAPGSVQAAPAELGSDSTMVIPIVEEQLVVTTQSVDTARVRLIKTVETYDETLNEPLAVREYDIERTILNCPVDSAPPVREEGNSTVYSLVEEQLVLTKQLILREEVRVTKRDTERLDQRTVTLTREHLTVEREIL